MRDTTVSSVFPDDELRRGLQQLIRLSRILEPHSGAGTHASLSEVMALGELADVERCPSTNWRGCWVWRRALLADWWQDSSTADGYHESGTQTIDASTDSSSPTTGKPLPGKSGKNCTPGTQNCSTD